MDNKLLKIMYAGAVQALSLGITFGMYGYFKDKGHSSFKSGLWSGGILGVSSATLLYAMGWVPEAAEDTSTAGCFSGNCAGMAGVTLTQLPKSVGYLTAQQLSGITVTELGATPSLSMQRQQRRVYRGPRGGGYSRFMVR